MIATEAAPCCEEPPWTKILEDLREPQSPADVSCRKCSIKCIVLSGGGFRHDRLASVMQINLDPEATRRSVEQHAAEPQISIREHVRRLCLALGKSIESRRAVYLDTRYWIFLRDVIRDEPQKQVHVALLDELEKRVTAGSLFCPISDATFLELLKQTRPESRQATAEIVDRLSLGVSLCGEQQRMFSEIYYLLKPADEAAKLAPIWQMVWVRLAYALGISYPSHTSFPAQTELTLQKAFTDYLWNIPLAEHRPFARWQRAAGRPSSSRRTTEQVQHCTLG